jgi:hypothetical protein
MWCTVAGVKGDRLVAGKREKFVWKGENRSLRIEPTDTWRQRGLNSGAPHYLKSGITCWVVRMGLEDYWHFYGLRYNSIIAWDVWCRLAGWWIDDKLEGIFCWDKPIEKDEMFGYIARIEEIWEGIKHFEKYKLIGFDARIVWSKFTCLSFKT